MHTSHSEESLLEENVRLKAQIEALRTELAETNTGVLALYSELDDKAAELHQASILKSRFLSYMSHEFRTPLGAILSLSRILMDRLDGPLSEEQEKQVRFIQSSAEELTVMTNDLLDLAKVEAGRITVSPAWFELVDLFAALRGMFKPILSSSTVNLIFDDPQSVPRLYHDDQKVSQILRNFISNALKFTQEGEVRVSATHEDRRFVVFTVKDTGIGIAKEHHGSLFKDFVQIDSPIQKRLRGTGLGLSLCKRLAELLGGEIIVESELGEGSSFSLRLPVEMKVASHPAAKVEASPDSVSSSHE
ncbi:sensor histidine kinase [Schlesneria sp. T3-172]|uniref:sensor histidine kinase n=1 Tax=Schlesneria sphaerica TaxID=3373610 RepID=UPI0037C91640